MRVRTTFSKPSPNRTRAFSILRIVCTDCAYISPGASTLPEGSVLVVPETWTVSPTCTARAYPTLGSQGVPEKILFRLTFMCKPPVSTSQLPRDYCGIQPIARLSRNSADGCEPPGPAAGGGDRAPRGIFVF